MLAVTWPRRPTSVAKLVPEKARQIKLLCKLQDTEADETEQCGGMCHFVYRLFGGALSKDFHSNTKHAK